MTVQESVLAETVEEGIAARAAALGVLEKILGQKKTLDAALLEENYFQNLSARDRAFVRMLIGTVLRRKGQLDDLIARALAKEAPRPEKLKWILYIGVAQILFMDVANHAAVDTSVTLTAQNDMDGKKGFVNAILRRMTNEGRAWIDSQDEAALNIPPWLYESWVQGYGVVRAKDIARALLREAPLDISLKIPESADQWAQDLKAEILPTGTLRRKDGGLITALEGYDRGAWWVQDASSALPVKLFGDIDGKTVLDMCAAPGGKTMQLAAAGAHVIALDRNARRMVQVHENLERVGLRAKVDTIIEDASVWKSKNKFSHVLLDAPCTATGTARRHPDLLSLKSPRDQDGLINIQERLLANAAELLDVGGVLIYCTCSLQKEEGEHQIQKFLTTHRNFKRVPVRREEFGGLDGFINGEGDVRIYPYLLKEQGGMDGFFISRVEKNASAA